MYSNHFKKQTLYYNKEFFFAEVQFLDCKVIFYKKKSENLFIDRQNTKKRFCQVAVWLYYIKKGYGCQIKNI